MKTLIIIAILVLVPTQSFAEDSRSYLAGKGGFNFSESSFGALAYGISKGSTRYEIEYIYKSAEDGEDKYEYEGTHALMLNAYKQFKPVSFLTPYVGLGLGVVSQKETNGKVFVKGYTRTDGTYVKSHYRNRPNNTTAEDSDGLLGYQIMLGTTTEFTDRWSSDLGYRMFGAGDRIAHGIEAGLRYNF